MASAKKQVNRSTKHGPYEGTLLELVKKLQNEPFLFVIAIAILLIGLVVLASALGTSDLRFIVIVIAFLALTAIIGYFIGKLVQVETRQALQESEIKAIQIALKGILTKHETGPLTGLNGLEKVLIRYEPDLYWYLHRLDGLGFIQPNKGYGLYDIVKEHRDDERFPYEQRPPFDLKKYVYITDEGKKYGAHPLIL
ncbi:MAG TPA: hypothetical protein VGX03_16490 [Candidatus Binatia bacterium]|jgi:hypothetical protein|nr:hypothetical protein [Candidatus Binatia bacterium]